jgi:hypothetical protein
MGVTANRILDIDLLFIETSLRSELSFVSSEIRWIGFERDTGVAYFFIATTGKVGIVETLRRATNSINRRELSRAGDEPNMGTR